MKALRRATRWSAVIGMALVVACSGPSSEPSSDRSSPPPPIETSSPATHAPTEAASTPGWNVSDAKVTTREQLAYWIVSYDAEWTGEGPPGEERCVFKVRNQEDIVVWQTGETLMEGDDVEAEIIYPDEVPGQPRTVTIDCESG